jgi:F420-0:gamma-glutamyl ligase
VSTLSLRSLEGIPEVREGEDVAALVLAALGSERPNGGQLLVIAQTVV